MKPSHETGEGPADERDRLRRAVAAWCLEHGLARLSLRAVARDVGTNNRMLLYYFGSKESLVVAAIDEAARQHWPLARGSQAVPPAVPEGDVEEWLRRTWRDLSAPANLPFLRLFFEVAALAIQDPGPYEGFLRRIVLDPPNQVAARLRAAGAAPASAAAMATEVIALWRGLQFELVAAGDRPGLTRVHDRAVGRILRDHRLRSRMAGGGSRS